ncbi:MAG: DUF368 domain-containing protein [Thermodesulfobacteriota bacterium]|nr:DUF368 domain-containing protein [Thermodesulfobacteriota bacterium]
MNTKQPFTWAGAFFNSPGPRTKKASLVLYLKGICMGTADVIPGVSGGTIALITGIYEQLLGAIKSFDTNAVKKIFTLQFRKALAGMHARFLIILLAGIATAIISIANIMNHLLHHYPVMTWSLFFGLIAASILVVGTKVEQWNLARSLSFILGTVSAWLIVGMIPVSTPETAWFIFFSGFVAICAMILPGLSGAFLLLILGKYEFVTAALKNPVLPANMVIIAIFCTGCALGLLCFSRILNYLLTRWHSATLAFLTGLMAGSMRKIWPWKETLETAVIRGKEHVLRTQNVLPDAFSTEVMAAIGLAVAGFFIVVALERLSRHKGEEV